MIRQPTVADETASDEPSMRLIEYALAVVALVAAGILAFVR
jgi:hypothetical protein